MNKYFQINFCIIVIALTPYQDQETHQKKETCYTDNTGLSGYVTQQLRQPVAQRTCITGW